MKFAFNHLDKFKELEANRPLIHSIVSQIESEAIRPSSQSCIFPISVMPSLISDIIYDAVKTYRFNLDFIACAILSAASTAIGTTHKLKIKGTWEESCTLYLVLVGRPGVNKSAPLQYAYKPIRKMDSSNYKMYKEQMVSFKSAKNAENAENAHNRPKRKQSIISDATTEAIGYVHSINTRGLCLLYDELAGWFKNFSRYNKGSDVEFWLSNWSGEDLPVNRRNEENTMLIENPFINIIGTIQPTVLNTLMDDSLSENGFADRLLFVNPEIERITDFRFCEPSPKSYEQYERILKKLLSLDDNEGKPTILTLSEDAKQAYQDWYNTRKLEIEQTDNDRIIGIFAKLEVYVFRFSFIFQLLNWACEYSGKVQVEKEAMFSAIETAEYFYNMAVNIRKINKPNELPLTMLQASIYNELPQFFTTEEGLTIAEKNGMPERTFKDWIKTKAFVKVKHGNYKKGY